MRIIDLTNQVFGRLTVIERAKENLQNRPAWVCQCECGKTTIVRGQDLRDGKTKSCGCLNTEKRTENGRKNISNKIGQKFGYLTVIKDSGERNSGRNVIWECLCDCGNKTKVSTSNLTSGHVTSCGKCQHKLSIGEVTIKTLLEKNNISFEMEKIFENCIYEDTKAHPRFDFYIDNKYLLEFDGQQHETGWYYLNEEEVKRYLNNDKFKNQWCKENNIPLIRIPYTHLKNLKIEDLLLETSNFIIKE